MTDRWTYLALPVLSIDILNPHLVRHIRTHVKSAAVKQRRGVETTPVQAMLQEAASRYFNPQ